MKYRVRLQRTDEGVTVSCPDLPGCISEGATEEEALENIKSAITEYLEAIEELSDEGVIEVKEVEVTI